MTRTGVIALTLDVAIVVAFVLFGRETHDSPFHVAESTRIAAPFMLGLGVAWLLPQTRRSPWRVVAGVFVGAITAAVGIAVRSLVFGDGISGAFPVVTALFLIGLMTAHRVLLALRHRRRSEPIEAASRGPSG